MIQPAIYNDGKRLELESTIGVETNALLKAVEIAGNYPHWKSKDVSLKLDDTNSKSVTLFATTADTLDLSVAKSFANLISPLIFLTSYKVIDMFFEWMIVCNGNVAPKHMATKVSLLKQNITKYHLPSPIDSKSNIALLLFEIYEKMMHFRHALTHKDWGIIDANGDIHFDFNANGKHIKQIITFSQVLDLSYLSGYSMDLIINNNPIDKLTELILNWLSDRIQPILGYPSKGLLPPLYDKVLYEVKQTSSYPIVINLKDIKSKVLARNKNRDCIFDLTIRATIESVEKTWIISAENLPDTETLLISHSWELDN